MVFIVQLRRAWILSGVHIDHIITELTVPLAFNKILKECDIERINLDGEKGRK